MNDIRKINMRVRAEKEKHKIFRNMQGRLMDSPHTRIRRQSEIEFICSKNVLLSAILLR